MEKTNSNLQYLSELSDYTVADNDKDIRGWGVKDPSGKNIGKVTDLVVNKELVRVVYLVMEAHPSVLASGVEPFRTEAYVDDEQFNDQEGKNHLLIPIGKVELDEDNEIVKTDISQDVIFRTKRIRKGEPIERSYENLVLETYGAENLEVAPASYYHRQEFAQREPNASPNTNP